MVDQPTAAIPGDAGAAAQANGAVQPGLFTSYMSQGAAFFSGVGNSMMNMGQALGKLPGLTIGPGDAGIRAKSNNQVGVPDTGPANVFDAPTTSGAPGAPPTRGGAEAPTVKSGDATTAKAANGSDAPSMAKLTFEGTKDNAHLLVDKDGNVTVNDKNKDQIAKSDNIKTYLDPKFDSKSPEKMAALVSKANEQLKAYGKKVEVKAEDMVKTTKAAQEAQTKAEKAKPETPMKKATPPGGGGGGGGGGSPPEAKKHTPDAPPHTPKEHTTNSKRTNAGDLQKMSAQVSEDHKAADGSHYKGAHPESHKNFTEEVFSRVPAFHAQGGLGSVLSTIDAEGAADDPNSPGYAERQKARAARRAQAVGQFQKEHGSEIDGALADFRNESKQAGLDDTVGFDNIAKSLADPSKAGDIAGLLSKKPIPGETLGQMADRVSKVYDSSAQIAVQNAALAESKDAQGKVIDWKAPTKKGDATSEALVSARAAAAAAVSFRPFSFKRNN